MHRAGPSRYSLPAPAAEPFFTDTFDPVIYRLMTFPLVTIAAINGHGTSLFNSRTKDMWAKLTV